MLFILPSAENQAFCQCSAIQDKGITWPALFQTVWCIVSDRNDALLHNPVPTVQFVLSDFDWSGVVLLHTLEFHGVHRMAWLIYEAPQSGPQEGLWQLALIKDRQHSICPSLSTYWHGLWVCWQSNNRYKWHIKSCSESRWLYSILQPVLWHCTPTCMLSRAMPSAFVPQGEETQLPHTNTVDYSWTYIYIP